MNDVGNLLQMIYDLLSGWFTSFTSHALAVMEKLNLIETDTASIKNSASDIKSNTDTIKDNTGAIITPVQSIKTNTDSIKNDTTNIKNNVSTMTNQLGTISTNVGTASAFTEDIANNTLDIKDKIVTIASDTTQIRANTNTVVTDMSKVYEALKWSLVDKVTTETVEGTDSISFDTDLTNDLVSLEVGIDAIQSGTGTPALDNNRPYTGHSVIDLIVNGVQRAISLGNTYYNALIDLSVGKITEFKKAYNFTGNENWTLYTGTTPFWYFTLPNNFKGSLITSNGIDAQLAGTAILRVYFQNNVDANTDMHTIFYNGTQIYAELNTPLETAITPSQIATIKGINTISTDGTIKATYEESIKHYLDKQEA